MQDSSITARFITEIVVDQGSGSMPASVKAPHARTQRSREQLRCDPPACRAPGCRHARARTSARTDAEARAGDTRALSWRTNILRHQRVSRLRFLREITGVVRLRE